LRWIINIPTNMLTITLRDMVMVQNSDVMSDILNALEIRISLNYT